MPMLRQKLLQSPGVAQVTLLFSSHSDRPVEKNPSGSFSITGRVRGRHTGHAGDKVFTGRLGSVCGLEEGSGRRWNAVSGL